MRFGRLDSFLKSDYHLLYGFDYLLPYSFDCHPLYGFDFMCNPTLSLNTKTIISKDITD